MTAIRRPRASGHGWVAGTESAACRRPIAAYAGHVAWGYGTARDGETARPEVGAGERAAITGSGEMGNHVVGRDFKTLSSLKEMDPICLSRLSLHTEVISISDESMTNTHTVKPL